MTPRLLKGFAGWAIATASLWAMAFSLAARFPQAFQ